ncbi:protein of unknown function [Taphrina deformans PYCC 5710]|uniref:DUF4604 domain-containing protein n=1 Tax=Taphrina deformans (strain PYCC 5710 / ATCC 11124 / CBS 356.35 / IMI 108563 / JCM 9778 / NBRC 8474) TaxID=1097556 RepID=R4XAY1_TAPDE|nr:protein of unknown function [Taphrina deformans PYCC 5710]|eukprot:CCG81483.1 protein of unknown function [Taphrina deformans PYCC 5710]
MSKLKPPVFEKPEEPDFIKRIKNASQATSQAQEKPMTDAPTREDEMPAIEGIVNQDDLEKLREIHGLEKSADVLKSSVGDTLSFPERSTTKKEKLAGLGRNLDSVSKKRLKHLGDLKSRKDTTANTAEDQASSEVPKSPSADTKVYAKRSATGRKKMKLTEIADG